MKEIDALAIYYYAKRRCVNSVVYNWSYKRISEYLGLSYHKTNKYIKILKKKGFVYEHGNNLVFQSMAKVIDRLCDGNDTKASTKIKILYSDNIESIADKLITLKLHRVLQKQQYIVKLKADIQSIEENKHLSLKKAKKLIKLKAKNPGLLEKSKGNNVLNCRKTSDDFNISTSSTCRMLKRLESKGFIQREKLIEKLNIQVTNGFDGYIDNKNRCIGYYYIYNNILYNYIGTKTTINKGVLF